MFREAKIRRQRQQETERLNKKYAALLRAATVTEELKSGYDYDWAEEYFQSGLPAMYTSLLLEQAARYYIDCSNPDWYIDSSVTYGDIVLTDKAEFELRRLIRNERRAQIEWWLTKVVFPILQSVTAIIGVLIGLIAISKS